MEVRRLVWIKVKDMFSSMVVYSRCGISHRRELMLSDLCKECYELACSDRSDADSLISLLDDGGIERMEYVRLRDAMLEEFAEQDAEYKRNCLIALRNKYGALRNKYGALRNKYGLEDDDKSAKVKP
jgi:hypothetical protein